MSKDLQRDVEFIYEMGALRLIDRQWRRFHTTGFANLADHHFRVFWIAMILAKHEGGDTGKIAKLALVHDIAESRAGDVDYLARQYVERNEELAIKDMLADTAVEKDFLELWNEYEDRKTIESKIVKDADNLDVDFELAEQAASGNRLQRNWKDNRDFVAANKLFTKTAKQIYKQIDAVDPHQWHMGGRNRLNDGDWKK